MTIKQRFFWDDEEPVQPYPSDLINILKDELKQNETIDETKTK